MAKSTVKAAVPPLRTTVNVAIWVPALPSVIVTSLIDSTPLADDWSSLMIVPTPWPSLIVAPLVAPDRLIKKVSLGSDVVSPLIVTEIVWVLTRTPERQRARCRSVVATRRGGAVRGGKVYGESRCAAAAHNRERCDLGAGIAFRDRHIADRQRTAHFLVSMSKRLNSTAPSRYVLIRTRHRHRPVVVMPPPTFPPARQIIAASCSSEYVVDRIVADQKKAA